MKNILYCSCCGRQIVSRPANDKWTVGGQPHLLIGFGKVVCHVCTPDYEQWMEMEEERHKI